MSNSTHLKTCPQCHAPVPPDAPEGLCPKCVLAAAAAPTETGLGTASTAEIPSLARVAAAFPHLEILALIGRGGMGFVFKARQPHLDRFVALKLLPDRLARDSQFMERFNREGRVLARLSHPNIVAVFDFGKAGDFYFLLMEFVDGVNLRQAMRAARFSPGDALMIVPKICEALQFAHEQGVLHRDIKPENILLDARGRVKIADFGIAKLVEEDAQAFNLTATGAALGTPHYMAPEQILKPAEIDHRADIYSLGVVFYEMLTGELPLGRFGPPSSRTPLDQRVDEIVMRALERERDLRQANAGQMKTEVERVTSDPKGSRPAFNPASSAAVPTSPQREGPHGTIVTEPAAGPISKLSVTAALLVGGSLALAFMAGLTGLILRPPEVSVVVSTILSIAGMLGLVGTVLGWVALREIRSHQGALRGIGLGAFAALTFPVLLLFLLSIIGPYFTLERVDGTRGGFAASRWLILLFPMIMAAVMFSAARATVRWARCDSARIGRSLGSWIGGGLGILVLILGLLRMAPGNQEEGQLSASAPAEAAPPLSDPSPSFQVNFSAAPEQILTFELLSVDVEPPERIPSFCGFLASAPGSGPVFGEFILRPLTAPDTDSWTIQIGAGDGARTSGPSHRFGDLIPSPQLRSDIRYNVAPDSALQIPLTAAYAPGVDTNSIAPRPALSVLIRSQRAEAQGPRPRESTLVSTGSTNWGATLAQLAERGSMGVSERDTNCWIRFTFTAVELHEEPRALWLAIDYVSDVHGDCDRAYRWSGPEGFRGKIRTTEFIAGDPAKPVRHQRVETRLPEATSREEALRWRDHVGQELITHSMTLRLEEERPLFSLPLAEGTLTTSVGVKRPLQPSER